MGKLLQFDSFGSYEYIDENNNLNYNRDESVYSLYFQTLIIMSDKMDSFKAILRYIDRQVSEDDGWDIFSKIATEMLTAIENMEMRALLIELIKSHRKDDCDGPEIILK